MSNPTPSKLDQQQVLQRAFDETEDRLRVDASVSATISSIDIDAEQADIAIKDRVTDNLLKINADGSIDANVVVSHANDSIKVGDGTDLMAVNADGSINVAFAAGAEIKVTDGTDDLAVNADGSINVNVTGTVPLPSGAATAARQDTGNTSLASIDTKIPSDLTVTSNRLVVDGSGVTQPVSAASLPLPTGAATSANQSTEITHLSTIAGAVSGTEMQVDVLTLPALPAGNNNIGDVDVASLPSLPAGTNNIGDVDVLSLPALPTGSNVIGAVTQSGTWTVQPGNTANTTAWLTRTRDGSDQTITKAVTAAGDELVLSTNGATQLSFHAVGAFSGLIAVYASNDGSTWLNIPLFSWTDFSKQIFSADANIYSSNIGGFKQVKIRQVTLVSGTPTIYAWLNVGSGPQIVTSPLAASFNATASQGGTWTVQPGNTANTTPWRTSDTVNGAGVQGALNVTNASATEVKVGGSPHSNRKLVTLYNNSSVIFYWGWTNAVTSSSGTPIQPQQFASWNAGPSATIYVIAASGTTNDSRVTEAAF